MKKNQLKDLLDKYEAGTCDEIEKALLHEFFEDRLNGNADFEFKSKEHDHLFKDEIYNHILRRIEVEERSKSKFVPLFIKIAASVILMVSLSYLIYNYPSSQKQYDHQLVVKRAEMGQKRTIQLPDGTIVMLNANSELNYPDQFGRVREVTLKGEAYFEVVENKEKPFVVISGEVRTRVLGTSFNIRNYHESAQIEISLVSGSVELLSPNETLKIVPGEQAVYDISSKQLTSHKADLSNYLAWKDGVLVFDGSTLNEIANALERWYGIKITFESPQTLECSLHLSFDNMALTQVLDQITMVSGTKYEFIDNDQVLIKGDGCNNK
ncbi:FecR domain-containing protein [Fulvivirga sp.]|uniref:FecR family protein n=1 Tax=Fulvivirga sp. TaxID=1931237 RepID=UPI0032EE43F6